MDKERLETLFVSYINQPESIVITEPDDEVLDLIPVYLKSEPLPSYASKMTFVTPTEKGKEYINFLPTETIIALSIEMLFREREYITKNDISYNKNIKKLLQKAFTNLQKEELCIYLAHEYNEVRDISKEVYDKQI